MQAAVQHKRHAWVTLVMLGDQYVPGALVLGETLRIADSLNHQDRPERVCMVTEDVSKRACTSLAAVYDHVIHVPYLYVADARMITARAQNIYKDMAKEVCTKWRCLELVQYDKVVFLDADMFVVGGASCAKELFGLKAPAANFWARVAEVAPDKVITYYATDRKHGDVIPSQKIEQALMNGGFVGNGGIVVLEPGAATFAAYQRFLAEDHKGRRICSKPRCYSGPDETSLAAFYLEYSPAAVVPLAQAASSPKAALSQPQLPGQRQRLALLPHSHTALDHDNKNEKKARSLSQLLQEVEKKKDKEINKSPRPTDWTSIGNEYNWTAWQQELVHKMRVERGNDEKRTSGLPASRPPQIVHMMHRKPWTMGQDNRAQSEMQDWWDARFWWTLVAVFPSVHEWTSLQDRVCFSMTAPSKKVYMCFCCHTELSDLETSATCPVHNMWHKFILPKIKALNASVKVMVEK